MYTFIHVHTCTHTRTRTHTRTYTHTYTHTHIHTHVHTHVHTRTHTYIHIHTYTHTHIHTRTHTRTYTHIHTHVHAHKHTGTHAHLGSSLHVLSQLQFEVALIDACLLRLQCRFTSLGNGVMSLKEMPISWRKCRMSGIRILTTIPQGMMLAFKLKHYRGSLSCLSIKYILEDAKARPWCHMNVMGQSLIYRATQIRGPSCGKRNGTYRL